MRKTLRLAQIKAQVAEEVGGGLTPIDLGDGTVINLYVPSPLNEGDSEWVSQVEAAAEGGDGDERERSALLLILGRDPDRSAEDALAAWEAAGGTIPLLFAAWGAEVRTVRDALGELKLKR
jgi:hypothetical protein